MIPESPTIEIPLHRGGVAIVDARDYAAVKDYRWSWSNHGQGVVTYVHHREPGQKYSQRKGQTILLHNLISPCRMVAFKDGDKHNCRRENLEFFRRGRQTRRSKHGGMKGIHIIRSRAAYSIYRKAAGVQWRTHLAFSKPDALEKAKALAAWLFSFSREEFIAFAKSRPRRRKTFDIIEDWSCYEGRSFSNAELLQMGIFTTP